ncbi:MAG TPA: rhomboid family intramembrane serine protease [Thermoanaerobaculia bacterium]|nr:rhomboid family intramembrane serine protease [Thermoanaerobaculia bacterium]
MLFFPIGRDETEIRRHAWISYAIIVVNIAVFGVLDYRSRHTDYEPLEAKWHETLSYLFQHPYLTVPPTIEHSLAPPLRKRLSEIREMTPRPDEQSFAGAQQSLDDLVAELDALVRASPMLRYAYVPSEGSLRSMITAMFIHADFMHLIGNLLFFFVTAPFIEDVFGRPIFAVLYFSGGIAATLTHTSQHSGSLVPLVGASGAIAAVMGAYLFRFYRSKLEFFFVPFIWRPMLHFRFFLPAFVVLPLWFVTQFYLATQETEGSGVAFWTHVGGFVWGLAFAAVLHMYQVEQTFINPSIEGKISWTQDQRLILAGDALVKGDLDDARLQLDLLLAEQPDNIEARRSALDLAVRTADWTYGAQHASRLLDLHVRAGDNDLALELLQNLQPPGAPLSAAYYVRAGSFLERQGDSEWAFEMYRRAASKESSGEAGLRALLNMARLRRQARELLEARTILLTARAHPECRGEWAQVVDTQLQEVGWRGG